MAKPTHKTRLLDYLNQHGTITSLEAIRDLGNTRLSATVFDLRRQGHDIVSRPVRVPNRRGGGTGGAQYGDHPTTTPNG